MAIDVVVARLRTAVVLLILLGAAMPGPAAAQTVAPAFAGSYSLTVLGSVPGLPAQYGGLTFIDQDTILIGGAANGSSGRLYTIDVTRDAQGHITGFVGTVVPYGNVGEYNDGGVVFGPGGVLFTARWNIAQIGQTRPGSTDEDKITTITAPPLSMTQGPGGLAFVPAGMPGAGQFKVANYNDGRWYTVSYAPDGLGTYNLTAATHNVTLTGGPEGVAYVPPGSALFTNPSVLVSEYGAGSVATYDVDGQGNPIVATRRLFVSGLSGAEGAVIDPVTGDFLFSTFGGGNRVVRVSGFVAPNPPVQITGRIADPANVPLAGVTVTLSGSATGTTTTAADGTYQFTGLTFGGSYTVTPGIAGRLFDPLARTFANLTTDATADFVGTLVYQISGQVRDLNDTGVAGVTMTLSGSLTGTLTTDLNGNYVFANLPIGGTYTVTPSRGSFAFNPPSQTFPNLTQNQVAGFFIAEVGSFTRYFAEGATGTFFDTRIALLNATGRAATATVRFQRPAPLPEVTQTVPLAGIQRVTIDPKQLGLTNDAFSTVIESDQPVIADRTMTWDATGYGSHAETSIGRPLTQWFLAEGATIAGFDLFYLIQNPGGTPAQVEVRYLLPAPQAPIVRTYPVAAQSRFNIWVNTEGPPLDAAQVSAVITSNVPIIVERAMYRPVGSQTFGAGHESAGVEAPQLQWYFAEGNTGPFFDLFYLVANPNNQPSEVEARYLKPDGTVVTRTYGIPANSRFNIWVDFEGAELADSAMSTTFRVTNAVPVVIERAMWWGVPSGNWYEGHNTAGATATGEKWGLAEGESGGARALETYILIGNTSAFATTARVTLTYENGSQDVKDFGLPPSSRTNVAVNFEFPNAVGQRYGAIVESVGAQPGQLIVERAMYNNAPGQVWAAGTSALGTKLR